MEDFESSNGSWSPTGSNSSWAHGVPSDNFITSSSACGSQAWVTNLTGDYNSSENSFIESPEFDFTGLTSDPVLRFDHIFETEGCCDEGWVEYSTDAGTNWTKLGTSSSGLANWYNDSGNDWWDGTSGNPGEWRTAAHVLTGLAGEDSVMIRFAFSSDGSVTRNGFGVDNVLIFESIDDAAPIGFVAPMTVGSFGTTEAVEVVVSNQGSSAITSVQVCYVLNSGTPVCQTFTTNIAPATIDTVDFTQTIDLSAGGIYTLETYTVLSGEDFQCNDTTSISINALPTITSFPYFEGFEMGGGSWIPSVGSSWEHGMPAGTFIDDAAPCSQQAWVTNLDGDYQNSENSFLESPSFDFTGLTNDPVLRFDHIYQTEGCCDEGWVEFSTDGGGSWTKLGTSTSGISNWYNDGGNDWWDGTSGNAGEWRTAAHVLTGLAGEDSVRIRFAFSSDGSATEDGFGVDNLFVFEDLVDAAPVGLANPTSSGAFSATETITIEVFNQGTAPITSLQACYSVDGGTPVCETITTNIASLSLGTATFTQTADLSALGPHTVDFYTTLTGDAWVCNDTAVTVSVFTLPSVTTFPYIEDFESGNGNWLASAGGSWEHGVPNSDFIDGAGQCGNQAWVTNLDGDYMNNENSFMESPVFDFTGMTNDPILRFEHIFETEGCCDEGWVEFSTDGGANWSKLGTSSSGIANWYNDSGNDWWDGTSGNPGEWRTAAHILTGLGGEDSVRIRFALSSDGSAVRDGFGVDNIFIFETLTDATPISVVSPAPTGLFGSTETVEVSVANLGTNTITSLQVCYILDGGAPVCQTFSTNILGSEIDTLSFTQTADLSGAGAHDIIVYTALMGDVYTCADTISTQVLTLPNITSFPYIEDFEAGDGSWITEGSNTTWEHGLPNSNFITEAGACGDQAWVTNLDGDYSSSENSFLVSPFMDFTGMTNDPILRFEHIFETEGCCDEGWVEYSMDGGANWTKLGTSSSGLANWYNDSGNDWWDGTSGNVGEWRTAAHILTGLAGEDSVRIRFAFSSDGSVTRDGFGVDNLLVFESLTDATVAELVTPPSSGQLSATETVSASFVNQGTTTITSIEVCYVINGGTPVCETFTVNVAGGTIDTVTFTQTADFLAGGNYDVVLYTNLSGDAISCNDTIHEMVTSIPTISTFPYAEDFESGNGVWIAGGTASSWEHGIPDGDFIASTVKCGENAWVTNLDGDYNNNENSFVESPIFDFTGVTDTLTLRFDHIYETESCCDEGWVEYSTDAGANWTKLGDSSSGIENWYNDSGNDWWDGNSGASNVWRSAAHSLGAVFGEDSVRFRFFFSSDGSSIRDGFGFDNVTIYSGSQVDAGMDTLGSPMSACSLGSMEIISAAVTNFGPDTITSLPICYVINGGTPVCETLTVNIGGDETITASFATTADFSAPGVYDVMVYTTATGDFFDCNDTAFYQVVNGEVNIALADTSISCNGANDGTIAVTASTGEAPFSYLWSNGETTATIDNLAAGPYTVTVTSASGCTETGSAMIAEPTALMLNVVVDSNSTCGLNNGGMVALPSGGTMPYTYNWSNGANTQINSGLAAAVYTVTVTDGNGCTITGLDTVTQPGALSLSITLDSNVACNAGLSGGLTGSATGGTLPYTYDWSNSAVTASITGVAAGAYTLTVTDADGCSFSLSETVTEPTAVVSAAIVDSNVTCNTFLDGGATASATGGTGAYTFAWSNSAVTASITGVASATYSVTITDANGCTDSSSVSISEPAMLMASINIDDSVSCNGFMDGQLTGSGTGGTMPYSYDWSSSGTAATESGLAAGPYTLTLTDANGCEATATATISEPAALVPASVVDSNASCNGFMDGGATASAAGGVSPYTYLWSVGSVTQASIGILPAGTHTVTVTDDNGCNETSEVTITEPTALVAATVLDSNASCFGFMDGGASGSAMGGTMPYTYAWNTTATTASITGIAAGTYTLIAMDDNGCLDTSEVVVSEPTALASAIIVDSNVTCNGLSDGGLTAAGNGGTAPYTYVWSNTQTTASADGLAAGTHTVTITDDNGCELVSTGDVTEPDAISINGQVSNTTCSVDDNGGIDISVTGGTAPYVYAWSNSETTEDVTDLMVGNYTVDVIDDNDCQETASFDVSFNAADPMPNLGNDTSICSNATFTLSPGDYASYAWSDGSDDDSFVVSEPGTYSVIVTSDSGCVGGDTIMVDTVFCVGISERGFAQANIKLFPNPTSGIVSISFDDAGLTVSGVTVMDLSGTLVKSEQRAFVSNETIDLTGLASGTYFILMETNRGTQVGQIVLQ